MTMSEESPLHAPSTAARLARFIRSATRLIGAWRDRAAVDRDLSALNDRLLADIGVDSRRLREIARLKDLGSPSRSLGPTEVAQGAPAQDRSGTGCYAPPSAISNQYQAGPSNGRDPTSHGASPISAQGAAGAKRRAKPSIRLVPRGDFRA